MQPVRSLAEIIAFNEQNHERVMPYFGQERMLKAEEKGPLTDEAYREALADNAPRLARDEGIDATLKKHKLDAIVAPSGGPAWLTDWVNGDHFSGSSSPRPPSPVIPTSPCRPAISLDCRWASRSLALHSHEPTLIRLAYAFEQATCVRRKPDFRPTAALDPTGPGGK